MPIARDLVGSIRPFLKRREYLSVLGPRQSGKTTLLELLKEELIDELRIPKDRIASLTFEDRKLLAQFEKDPIPFVRSYLSSGSKGSKNRPFYLFMDEFQYAEEGGQKLKLIYDTLEEVKIIVTGSSSLDLKAKVGKYMVGRIVSFQLSPFNFREYLKAKNTRLENLYKERELILRKGLLEGKFSRIKEGVDPFSEALREEFEAFCLWGGYPAVVLAEDAAVRRKLLSEIYNQYILKDIKTLLELTTDRELFLLSQYLATQIGNLVIYQNLSQASGLDYRNLKRHLQILEETFVSRTIRPFFKNRQKELSKSPKIYFWDLGFRNYLMENMNRFSERPDAGAMVENVSLIRLSQCFEGADKINFWRTKAGAEVDFILHQGGEIIPIEVKYAPLKAPKLSRGFLSFIETFKPRHAAVLNANYWARAQKGATEILFAPVFYL
ncbi:MAG: ATP-binding protein [Candidatus Omnitrophica bacterium]|nr:ATP-binding protein [Candidatus Omnitrophota bacterium]